MTNIIASYLILIGNINTNTNYYKIYIQVY